MRTRQEKTKIGGRCWFGPRGTRGYGVLEGLLARFRARKALALLPESHPRTRLLDVGCGTYSTVLRTSDFAEKHGVDKIDVTSHPAQAPCGSIKLAQFDAQAKERLPYETAYFDVVTSLALVEHLEPSCLPILFGEIHRVLRPKGMFILTTPAPWTEGLLRWMARLRLVSPIEIAEHKATYGPSDILPLLVEAGFRRDNLRHGHFEAFMNIWVTATK